MLCRYSYGLIGDLNVYYGSMCDVLDFKKFWVNKKLEIDWCSVEIWDSNRGKWSLCDMWVYMLDWKKKGWYKKGWKLIMGV